MAHIYLTDLSCIKGCPSSAFSSVPNAHSSKQEIFISYRNLAFIFHQLIFMVCLSFLKIIFSSLSPLHGLIVLHWGCSTSHRILIHPAVPFYILHPHYCQRIYLKQDDKNFMLEPYLWLPWIPSEVCASNCGSYLPIALSFTSAWYSKRINFLRVRNQIRLSWFSGSWSLKRQKARWQQWLKFDWDT